MTKEDVMPTRWTPDEIERLKGLAGKLPAASIASELQRGGAATIAKAHELKISLRVSRTVSDKKSTVVDPTPAGIDLSR